ncbi:MAG TPA: surface-adhesin E family protein [Casimicrobiaceae bacterium]|nr:surface-adhesin E family protein [Casimicrobiaceae bacterium]
MMPRRLALAAVLAATTATASAAWEPLATTQLGDKSVDVFIDPARIRDQDGHKMVWQLDNLRDEVPANQARSAVRLFAVDCAKASTALADLVLYKGEMGKGASLGRQVSKTLEFEPALPDSIAELLVFRACIPPEQQRLLMQGDAKDGKGGAKGATDAQKPATPPSATPPAPAPAPAPK